MRDRRGAVALLFAVSLLPITLAVALAVDYSFYIEAHAQLNLAADAAALHAVRVASSAYNSSGGTASTAQAQAAGIQSGQQWFAAQVGTIGSATISPNDVVVNVTYAASPPGFTATVSYSGTVATHFGKFVVPAWNIADSASAVVQSAYVEFIMLLDNSSSMLLAATTTDILNLEQLTPCSLEAANEGQGMWTYSYKYPTGYGYPGYNYPFPFDTKKTGQQLGYITPTLAQQPPSSSCDNGTSGADLANSMGGACFFIPSQTSIPIGSKTGLCTSPGPNLPAGGSDGRRVGFNSQYDPEPIHTPQAPCAFACHSQPIPPGGYSPDYYGLAKRNNIQLRFDVVHQAAAKIVQTLNATEENQNQYSVGVYEFNSNLQTDYPPTGSGEASTDLAAVSTALSNIQPPITPSADAENTYFQASATALASILTKAGDGSSPNNPIKNLFIVTDGMSDTDVNGQQVLGTITSTSNEQICQMFKDKGFNVYVLYTQYLPVPTATYVNDGKQYAEPSDNSPITQALTACASSPNNFFLASDSASITNAMNKMLSAALNSAGRISN
jgi:Flp pilus assembly protein TadG